MSETQMTQEQQYAYARMGETIEQRLNDAYRRRERQVKLIVDHTDALRRQLTAIKHHALAEHPEANYGQRSTHWQDNGELQGRGGKLDMHLAVLAGIDDEIRTLRKVNDYYVASQ